MFMYIKYTLSYNITYKLTITLCNILNLTISLDIWIRDPMNPPALETKKTFHTLTLKNKLSEKNLKLIITCNQTELQHV